MANLERFKQAIGGGVRPNQFRVQLTAAPVGFPERFDFLCHASSLPGSNIGTAPVYHRGRMIPLAGERTFDAWSVVVYSDSQHDIRTQFEEWSNVMNNYADNTGFENPNIYKGEAIVTQLARNDSGERESEGVKRYKMIGIYPSNVSEIQLSWQQNDVVEEFSVTFMVERVDPFTG